MEGDALCPRLFPVGRARSAPSKTASELGLWPQSPVGIRAQRIRPTGEESEEASKRAAIRSSVAEKPPDMTNRVIAFVCLLGVSGALGQAQDFAQQTSDYYRGKRKGRGRHWEGVGTKGSI